MTGDNGSIVTDKTFQIKVKHFKVSCSCIIFRPIGNVKCVSHSYPLGQAPKLRVYLIKFAIKFDLNTIASVLSRRIAIG